VSESAAGPTDSTDGISLLDLLLALVERKRIILLVTVGMVVLTALLTPLLPVRYTARAIVLPPQQGQSNGSILNSQLANLGGVAALATGGLGLKNINEMYASMFRTYAVEDAMIQRFGLLQDYHTKYLMDARRTFEKRAVVDGTKKDGLIYVTVTDKDPRRAAEIANAYVDQFRELTRHLALTEASQRRLFFEQQLLQTKDDLVNAEEALKATEQKTGLIQLDSQARALIEAGAQLRAQITAKEVQIQSMRTYAAGQNAQLAQAQQELESIQAQAARLGASTATPESMIVPKGLVPEAGLEYIRRSRDVKYYETIFEILSRQYEVAHLDEAKQGTVVQVLDAATVPDRRSFPKITLMVIGAFGVGLVLGVFVALTQHAWRLLMNSAETAAKVDRLRASFRFRKRRQEAPVTP